MIKAIKILLKLVLILVIFVLVMVSILGGGWRSKVYSSEHPLYQGERTFIAHRGAADSLPENTLEAAQRAHDLGFNWIEIDVKESGDGVFFLFHDRDGARMLQVPEPIGPQSWTYLKQQPLYFNDQPTDYYIPQLEQFLQRFGDDFIIYFDIKRHGNDRYKYLADKWCQLLERHALTDRALIGSDFLFTTYLEYRYPQLHTVFTGPGDESIKVYPLIPKKFRPDFIISYGGEVTSAHMEWLRKNQLTHRRLIYGVNQENFQEMINLGVPKIVVDYHYSMQAEIDKTH